jgi:hypothetical protein
MIAAPPPIDISTLAFRVADRVSTSEWMVLLHSPGKDEELGNELAEALDDISGDTARVAVVASGAELIQAVHGAGEEVCIIAGLDALSAEEWRGIDRQRSQLLHAQCAVLLASPQSLDRLAIHAPHLASWIGPAIWTLDSGPPGLSDQEKEDRLRALREHYERSDHEVVDMAERRELPAEPDYAEWLVLLDRGDLIPLR